MGVSERGRERERGEKAFRSRLRRSGSVSPEKTKKSTEKNEDLRLKSGIT